MDIERTPYAYFDRDEIERVGISSKCLSCGYVPPDKDQLDDAYPNKIPDLIIETAKLNGVNVLSVKELEKGSYEVVFEQPQEKEVNALSALIEQVNNIRFSPVQIISHFNTFSLDKIEKHLGMPQGYLSKAIKNKRALPKEWEAALKKYLLNLAKNINEKMA